MFNLLVGLDGSRHSETALRQTLALADDVGARLHLLQAIEPIGPENAIDLSPGDDPLSILDRNEAMTAEGEDMALNGDDDLGTAQRICDDAGVACRCWRQSGMATRVLLEQSLAMDMLVLGRRGAVSRSMIGRTATSILRRPVVPTLLCQEDVVPWNRMLLVFEPTAAGGRALKLAGGLASELNAELDVLYAGPSKDQVRKSLHYAKNVLRAYHVEGEFVAERGSNVSALRSTALDLQSSVVITPDRPCGTWPWVRSELVRSAVDYPGAMTLVVP